MHRNWCRLYFRHWVNVKPKLFSVTFQTKSGNKTSILYNEINSIYIYLYSRATVYSLAQRGPKVIYATDLGLDGLEDLAKDVQAKYPGVQVIPRAVNAAKTSDITGVIDDAVSKFGRLDVFFANAGIATGNSLQAEDEESFMTMMRINALRLVMKALKSYMCVLIV